MNRIDILNVYVFWENVSSLYKTGEISNHSPYFKYGFCSVLFKELWVYKIRFLDFRKFRFSELYQVLEKYLMLNELLDDIEQIDDVADIPDEKNFLWWMLTNISS